MLSKIMIREVILRMQATYTPFSVYLGNEMWDNTYRVTLLSRIIIQVENRPSLT